MSDDFSFRNDFEFHNGRFQKYISAVGFTPVLVGAATGVLLAMLTSMSPVLLVASAAAAALIAFTCCLLLVHRDYQKNYHEDMKKTMSGLSVFEDPFVGEPERVINFLYELDDNGKQSENAGSSFRNLLQRIMGSTGGRDPS